MTKKRAEAKVRPGQALGRQSPRSGRRSPAQPQKAVYGPKSTPLPSIVEPQKEPSPCDRLVEAARVLLETLDQRNPDWRKELEEVENENATAWIDVIDALDECEAQAKRGV